jgi:branched-subunit amino acid ABC-type transport system permease component
LQKLKRRRVQSVGGAQGWGIAFGAAVLAVLILTLIGAINFQEFLSRVIVGMNYGCIYALLAVGLVVTYKTSGVFNLAYGAQAFVSGGIYYDARVRHNLPIPVALLLAVFIAAPLLGFVLDRLLFRYLRQATAIAKLVTALALLVAIPQIFKLWFGQEPAPGTQGIVPKGDFVYNPFGDVYITRNDIATIAATLIVVIGLTILFRYTALGLRMRAVVESARLTELAGTNADRVSMSSWILCSFIAGLAGVLLSPLFAQVSDLNYTTLVVVAISAAVVASLNNIPGAFLGGLALGIIQQLLDRYLPTGSILASNIRPALPFIALFLVLIFSPSLRGRRELTDPLAGVDPPPPAPVTETRSPLLTNLTRAFGITVAVIGGYYIFFHASTIWLDLAIRATILAVIFLSITVITGMAGQISLAQATFAGIGAAATAQLATRFGMSVLLTLLIGAALSALIGALLSIPALRLGGIFLALATFAFALFFDNVMARFDWVGGGVVPEAAPRPKIGPIDFDVSDKAYLVLCLIVLTIVALIVLAVRNGSTGRYLDALRGSETAAASIGINANRARITTFALAAGIAGIGGGLWAMYERAVNWDPSFVSFQGLVWVVLVVSLGSRTIDGAIQAAIGFEFFQAVVLNEWIPWVTNHVQPWYHMGAPPSTLGLILLTLGAFTYAKHPEGVLEFNKRKSLAWIQRQIDKRSAKRHADPTPPPSSPGTPAAVPAPAGGSSA